MSADLPRVPVLPTLVTLASGVCGFTAILYCCSGQLDHAATAAWLILAALVLDGVDGRLARMTRQATDFGIELDSLCDLVAFGGAPAILVLSVGGTLQTLGSPTVTASVKLLTRIHWLVGAGYVASACVRLARFNVITSLETKAHRHFVGLPSPAAAGLIAALVIAHAGLASPETPHSGPLVQVVVPVAMVLGSILMVSRVRYGHLLYVLSKSGRSLALVVELFFAGGIVVLLREFALAVLFVAYVSSGLVGVALDRVLERMEPSPEDHTFP